MKNSLARHLTSENRTNHNNKYFDCFLSYLGPDFKIQFAVDFSLSVVELPRSITLQIFDVSTFFSSLVAEIFLSIPDSEHTVSRTSLQEYQFSSQEKIDPAQCSVGSGKIPLQLLHCTAVGSIHCIWDLEVKKELILVKACNFSPTKITGYTVRSLLVSYKCMYLWLWELNFIV